MTSVLHPMDQGFEMSGDFGAMGAHAARPARFGKVTEVDNGQIHVSGIDAADGHLVIIDASSGRHVAHRGGESVMAEVIDSDSKGLICMPLGNPSGLKVGQWVRPTGLPHQVAVGQSLVGRVLDGFGRLIDDCGPIDTDGADLVTLDAPEQEDGAAVRRRIESQLGLGVRTIDTLMPVGRGQRIGVMAGPGEGKARLLSMIARGTGAQISVIALIGDSEHEVREFLEEDLGPEGLARSIVIVATADASSFERSRAPFVATRIAEWFRDAGLDVVLMIDSLTRVAMAQRDIDSASGESPEVNDYPPSVFTMLPELLQRAGSTERGSITGIYTVLVETDGIHDPIEDVARTILDGHIVLDRDQGEAGLFPNIDVASSVSRAASSVLTMEQRELAKEFRRVLAALREVQELEQIGAYVSGTNADIDAMLAKGEAINGFLHQDMGSTEDLSTSWNKVAQLVA